jgi:hypothetical protein
MPETQSDIYDRLSAAWRDAIKQTEEAAARQRSIADEDEEYVLRILKILLWCGGLGACFMLAWGVSGGSLLVTIITLVFPAATWLFCGLRRWGLLLPICLLAALALHGALQLW